MGAKYNFNAAFSDYRRPGFQFDVAIVGFERLWQLFDPPAMLLMLDYERSTEVVRPFDRAEMASLALPGASDVFAIHTESHLSSLMFFRDGTYLIAVASVEENRLTQALRRDIYEEFKESLRPFRPLVMATGEEWELSEPVVADLLAGRPPPREVEFHDRFFSK